IEVAWTAGHEQENDILGLARKMGRLGFQRIDLRQCLRCSPFERQQVPKSYHPRTASALPQNAASGLQMLKIPKSHGSIPGYEFIQVQQDRAHAYPGGCFGPIDSLDTISRI